MRNPIFFLLLLPVLLQAQQQPPQPTLRNVAYDDEHEAQVLDVYQPDSDKPTPAMIFIHGGGWRAGSKDRVPSFLTDAVREGWLTVVSVEYRFTDVAAHPAQVNDCIRAVQFTRSRAEEWGIDPDRIGVTGGSAGAHLSLWVALQDDRADPDAQDPVGRQSSRVAFAIGFAGPTDWTLLEGIRHDHPAYRQLLGYEPGTPFQQMDAEKVTTVSPITSVSADDPPILIIHGDADDVVPLEHGRGLHDRLTAAGVSSELFIVANGKHNVAGGADPASVERAAAFMREHLLPAPAATR